MIVSVRTPAAVVCHQGSPPVISARPHPRAKPFSAITPSTLQQGHRYLQQRPCAASAANKKKADKDASAAGKIPVESSEESGANDSDSVPEDSSLTQLIYRAIEAGNASDTEKFVEEAEELYKTATNRADAAEISMLASQATCEGLNDKYLRLSAEFENFRKRSAQEKTSALKKAKARVIEDLLPVVDAFEAAAGQLKTETEGEQKIAVAYQGLYAKLVDGFKKMGLEIVPGVGAPFDPEVHEAIMRAPANDQPEGTVLQEFRRGFRIDGTLLRAAMVQVSFVDEDENEDASDTSEDF